MVRQHAHAIMAKFRLKTDFSLPRRMHAYSSHARRRAEHAIFFRVRIARAQLEHWPPQGGPAICAACAPMKKKQSYSKADEKMTLSAAHGPSKVVSESA